MWRFLKLAVGPELVMALVVLGVYGVCAQHPSGEGRDLLLMEQMVWLVPPAAAALAFATILVPGAGGWGWLVRANLAAFVGAGTAVLRIIAGFGTGAKGQDAAFIMAMVLVVMVAALGTAIAGAVILVRGKGAFAAWFGKHPVLGSLLTLIAAIPIGLGLGLGTATLGGVVLGVWVALSG